VTGPGLAERAFPAGMRLAAALSLVFLVAPVAVLVPMSLGPARWLQFPPTGLSLAWYGRVLGDRDWLEAAGTSLMVATAAALVAALFATPAALALARGRVRGRAGLRALLLLPVVVPVMVLAIALYGLYAGLGLGGSLAGLALAHALLGTPYVVLAVEGVARTLDPALERAARGLGATAWQAFVRVTLPLSRAGVLAGALFAFIVSLDEVVLALFLSGPRTMTLPVKMWTTITQDEFDPTLTAVATLQLVAAVLVLAAVQSLDAGGRREPSRAEAAPGAAPAAPGRPLAERGAGGARLRLAGVTRRFAAASPPAVDGLTLDVGPGELLALVGPSGSGKTTVLNLVAGFEAPDAGAIVLGETALRGLAPHRREIGMVFQDYALFPHLSVADNVAFPLRLRGVPAREIATRVATMLELVRLPGHQARRPAELSGGERQRVALARALVFRPPLLLMDEPLGALDRELRASMQGELRELQRGLGLTTVFVTHDQAEAMSLGDRIAILAAGRLQQVGRPAELYDTPANPFVARFLGESSLLAGVVEATDGGQARVRTAGGSVVTADGRDARPGERVHVLLRPEALHLGGDPPGPGPTARLDGTLEEAVYLGPVWRYRVRLNALETVMVTETRHGAAPGPRSGGPVTVGWRVAVARLLREPDGEA
jgi:ABC-type Fe3+/spermidine/putrescine transport system ATPase subunit/ABC-type spermidine/putrescine transport system permease subunit II